MRPQDVQILLDNVEDKPQPEKPQEAGSFSNIKPVRPTAISEQELNKRISEGAQQQYADGMLVVGNISAYADSSDIPLRFVSRCAKFDLSAEEDRIKYAELFGKSGDACGHIDIIWEKQVVFDDKLIIYVTYTETLRVSDD